MPDGLTGKPEVKEVVGRDKDPTNAVSRVDTFLPDTHAGIGSKAQLLRDRKPKGPTGNINGCMAAVVAIVSTTASCTRPAERRDRANQDQAEPDTAILQTVSSPR